VSLCQLVVVHIVEPMLAVGDWFVEMMLIPSSVNIAAPVPGAFPARVKVTTGASNVKSAEPVPNCEYNAACTDARPYNDEGEVWQATAVAEVQPVVLQVLLSTTTLGVKSFTAKPSPEIVKIAPPVLGAFQRLLWLITGAPKVKTDRAVPTMRLTVRVGDSATAPPARFKAEPWQITELVVDHAVVVHTSALARAKASVAVASVLAKPSPNSVMDELPEAAALVGARLVATGASYDKLVAVVPYVAP